jgi:hypothetical protein
MVLNNNNLLIKYLKELLETIIIPNLNILDSLTQKKQKDNIIDHLYEENYKNTPIYDVLKIIGDNLIKYSLIGSIIYFPPIDSIHYFDNEYDTKFKKGIVYMYINNIKSSRYDNIISLNKNVKNNIFLVDNYVLIGVIDFTDFLEYYDPIQNKTTINYFFSSDNIKDENNKLIMINKLKNNINKIINLINNI